MDRTVGAATNLVWFGKRAEWEVGAYAKPVELESAVAVSMVLRHGWFHGVVLCGAVDGDCMKLLTCYIVCDCDSQKSCPAPTSQNTVYI